MNEIPEVLQQWKTHYLAPAGIELKKALSQVLVAIEAHQRAAHRLFEVLICLSAGRVPINAARLTEAQPPPSPPATRDAQKYVNARVAAIVNDPAGALRALANEHSSTGPQPKWSPSDFTRTGEFLSRESSLL